MRRSENKSRGFAKVLRRRLTDAEVILWSRVRTRDLQGYKFRRQHPIGPFIADFACVECKLVLEVDGGTHSTQAEIAYDKRRDAYLKDYGWHVIRVQNEDIYRRLDSVLDMLASVVTGQLPPPGLRPTSPETTGEES